MKVGIEEGAEISRESDRPREWVIAALIAMPLLLFSTPFLIEIRVSTDTGFVTAYFIAWLWAYNIVGYETGFFNLPSYQHLQHASLFFFPHFIFLAAMIALLQKWISKKTAFYAALLSLLPSLIVLIVNLALGVLVAGSPTIIAPVPLPFATIIGLVALEASEMSSNRDAWLSESNNSETR